MHLKEVEDLATVGFKMVARNGKWHDVIANGDSKAMPLRISIALCKPDHYWQHACYFSEDLRRHIVSQSIYKWANPDEIAESLYVCERTVRRTVGHFLTTEDVSIGRPRALTSLEETLILNVILENSGIYLDEVQRYLEKKPGMVISISTICRTSQWLGLTWRKISDT